MPTPPLRSHPTESISLALKCSRGAYPLSALLACCYGHFCISGCLNSEANVTTVYRVTWRNQYRNSGASETAEGVSGARRAASPNWGRAAASWWFMPPGVSGATNKSERHARNKLNLPRGQRRRHSAERKVSHISVYRPEVGMVEEVEEIEAQLQIAGFAEPRKMSILG